jgi:hypothetical protein
MEPAPQGRLRTGMIEPSHGSRFRGNDGNPVMAAGSRKLKDPLIQFWNLALLSIDY